MSNFIEVTIASSTSNPSTDSIVALILGADFIVQMVLLSLVFMSIGCWTIIIKKGGQLKTALVQSNAFLDVFWNSKRLDTVYEVTGQYPGSPVAAVFMAGYQELARVKSAGRTEEAADNVSRSLRRASMVEMTKMEQYITFLATTGATAPFIGLFGTVWGILRAFQKLGTSGQATIQVVGPDIAHALIATAVGLAAAIPAVMAYNYFGARLRVLETEMENFSSDFLNLVKRHLK